MASMGIAMTASLGMQGWTLFREINQPPESDEPTAPITSPKPELLKQSDFSFLFGVSEQSAVKREKADIPKTRLSLVLRGALTGLDGKKYASAIIQGAHQDQLYEVGDSLAGDVILTEVFADHVVLNRRGQLETLYFPEASKDSRGLQEYKSQETTKSGGIAQDDYNDSSGGKSLEQRMQELHEKLQKANQGN